MTKSGEKPPKSGKEQGSSDELFFDENPNAARFRDMAHRLLSEPGATKEGVQQSLKADFGVDDETLGHIFHIKQQAQLQQQPQANASGSPENNEREKKIREAALALSEIRGKGNKGTVFLRNLKKEKFTDEEIAKIDEAAGAPAEKRSRKPDSPRGSETTAEEVARENEESRRNNVTWIQQQRAQGVSDQDIITTMREKEWNDNEIIELLTEANGLAPAQAAEATPDTNTAPRDGKRARGEAQDQARRDAFQVLRDREDGKSDEEITKLMEAVGISADDIARRLRLADSIAASREKKVQMAELMPKLKKINEIFEAAERREQAIIDQNIAAAHAGESAPGADVDVDTTEAVNPFTVGKAPADVEAPEELATEANLSYEPAETVAVATPDVSKEAGRQQEVDAALDAFQKSGKAQPMPSPEDAGTSPESQGDIEKRMRELFALEIPTTATWKELKERDGQWRDINKKLSEFYENTTDPELRKHIEELRGEVVSEAYELRDKVAMLERPVWEALDNGTTETDTELAQKFGISEEHIAQMRETVERDRKKASSAPVDPAEQAAGEQERREAHTLSEAKTQPYEEYEDIIKDLPVEDRLAYHKLGDAVYSAIESGDVAAQQKAMTSLDAFMGQHRPLVEEKQGPVLLPDEEVQAPDTGFSDSDRALLGSEAARTERMTAIRARLTELENKKQGGTEDHNDFIEATNLELELEDLEADTSRAEELTGGGVEGEFPDTEPLTEERTPKEWKERLASLIAGAKETAGKTKEKVAWWKNAGEGLIRRNEELDLEAEKIGGAEKLFRALGERYNKYGWKTKLAVGAALGLGAVVSAGSLPLAFTFLSGVAVQRIAGLSTMYLKFEKSALDKGAPTEWLKEKAMGKALAYTVLFGLAEKEAIALASESSVGQWMQHKLANLWPFGSHEKPSAPMQKPEASAHAPAVAPAESGASAPEHQAPTTPASAPVAAEAVPAKAPPVAAPGTVPAPPAQTPEVTPQVPSEATAIDIAASKGHGYEYMTKRLWEQLQEKHVTLPQGANPDSDLAKLLSATPETIDKVVHQLAQENEFFKSTGTSVRIDLDSHLTIDNNGNLLIKGADFTPEGTNLAPDASAETPAQPESSVSHSEPTSDIRTTEVPAIKQITPVGGNPDALDLTPASGVSQVEVADSLSSGETLVTSHSTPDIEHQPSASAAPDLIINKYSVEIPAASPNLYTSGKEIFVFGGSSTEQAKTMLEYLTKHPSEVIISSDDAHKYRVPWHLVGGKLVPGAPLQSSGFLGLGKAFLPPPGPEEFRQLIK
jgi:hypothetical protein